MAAFDHLLPDKGNLWGSILDSVSANRQKASVPTRNVIVLGERGVGKSTVVSYLSESQPGPSGTTANGVGASSSTTPAAKGLSARSRAGGADLGMTYTTADVGDEGDEEALGRLSIHQIPSSASPHSTLLPLTLNSDTIRESLILILVPFTNPHTILTCLCKWLALVQAVIESIRQSPLTRLSDRGEVVLSDAYERLESHLRTYTEPTAGSSTTTTPAATTTAIDADIPLPSGTLTTNLGIPIIIACTKSDQMEVLERTRNFKEEHFDYIQQSLRTICLRYGAALFYTCSSRPTTLKRLRSYILHRLFGGQVLQSGGSAAEGGAATAKAFGFNVRANVVDREEVLVPTGWDSWGKIKVLREGFDTVSVGEGWEADIEEAEVKRIKASSASTKVVNGTTENGVEAHVDGACAMWEIIIPDPDGDRNLPSKSRDRIVAIDEQSFLKAGFEKWLGEREKEKEKDPRSHFQSRPSISSGPHTGSNPSSAGFPVSEWIPNRVGVVGPMSSERDLDDVSRRPSRKDSLQSNGTSSRSTLPTSMTQTNTKPIPNSANSISSTSMRSPLLSPGNGSTGTPGRPEKEVLQNFFDKLLQKDGSRPRIGTGITAITSGGSAGGGVTSPTTTTNTSTTVRRSTNGHGNGT